MIRFASITENQKESLIANGTLNGCGGKGSFLNPPDWIFTASCYHHDFNYWLGHTEEDRKKADWQFYQAMVYDANQHPWYKKYLYRVIAWTYYKAVRMFAMPYFNYADSERTEEDLLAALDNRDI